MRVCSLGSGSKGNCIYIECEGRHIVIDNGLSCKELSNRMNAIGLQMQKIDSILITHEHSDHIKGIGVLSRSTNAMVYAHPECYNAFGTKVGDINYAGNNNNYEGGFDIGSVHIKPFRTPHDAVYSVGYRIEGEGKTITLATDLGVVNDAILKHLTGVDLAILESNHDIEMLKRGSYPEQLKRRILSNHGHLANEDAAKIISKLALLNTKAFWLAHLSEDNNIPSLAFNEAHEALHNVGASAKDCGLLVLEQYKPSKILEFKMINKKLDDLGKSYFGLRVSDGAGAFVAGFVFLYIFQTILMVIADFAKIDLSNNMANTPVWFTWVLMIVNQLALALAVVVFGLVVGKPVLQECRITQKISPKQALLIPIIALACIAAFMPIATGFVKLVELLTNKPQSAAINIGTKWWEILISLVFVSVLPAIGEELLFRGAVAKGLKRKNYVFAIVISGLLFSIFHGSAAQTMHQFLIGMVFAYLYFVTGSLLASMIAHFANNAFAIIFDSTMATTGGNAAFAALPIGAQVAIYVVMSVVGFAALYFLLRLIMKISKQEKNIIEPNVDKNAWAKDIAKAFTIAGIKDNYHRLNNSLKDLFDDPCDAFDVNGDIVLAATDDENDDKLMGEDDKLAKMLEESNRQTIKKRTRFDYMSLLAAIGIALIVWIVNLIGSIN